MAVVTGRGGRWPAVEIVEEAPREGMQIESRSITTAQKIELINRLSRTGLTHIVVGSFVSPRWVPQMSDIEDVLAGIEPVAGVRYRALAFNAKGRERRAAFEPPISAGPGYAGPCPDESSRYPVLLPLIETLEEAQHFRIGPRAYAGSRAPWRAQDPLYELADAADDWHKR